MRQDVARRPVHDSDIDIRGAIDFTPAPVVIGINASASASGAPTSDPHLERQVRAARNTPAEPIASVRVRERAAERASVDAEGARKARDPEGVCDDRIVTVTELQSPAQYFPPMRPPESAHGHVSTHPKVQVVPDCDTRQRTARSLRRLSTMPPPATKALGLVHGWTIYFVVALFACGAAIALVRGFTAIGAKRHVVAPSSNASARASGYPAIAPAPESRTPGADAGSTPSSPAVSAPVSRRPTPEGFTPKQNATRISPAAIPSADVTVF